jgi:hypothetical protein
MCVKLIIIGLTSSRGKRILYGSRRGPVKNFFLTRRRSGATEDLVAPLRRRVRNRFLVLLGVVAGAVTDFEFFVF